MSQQFYDHFAEANKNLAERLGTSRVTLNRDSAVLSTQTRSLVQMLNYGLDSMTVRAASHLLNFNLLQANTAYLMKFCEGLLLNSIKSITPPHLPLGKPFRFSTPNAYTKYSIIGTCKLQDGTPCNLIIYKDPEEVTSAPADTYRYSAYYCAGAYVHQSVPVSSLDFTPGTHQSVFIPERYKTVWCDSVEVKLERDNGEEPLKLSPYWSFDELLASSDLDNAVLLQHSARGITITLGDGEVFGKGYNKRVAGAAAITNVLVNYIKCESLADADHASVSFNDDISIDSDIPLLTKTKPGDTAASLRMRALAEFFAAGKITDERDMETELRKIPIIKSAHCKREYDYPLGKLMESKDALEKSIPAWKDDIAYTAGIMVQAPAPANYPAKTYAYLCLAEPPIGTKPAESDMWAPMFPLDENYRKMMQKFYTGFPQYQVYDNATLVVTGLMLRSRYYYREGRSYAPRDVVYYPKTGMLYKAIANTYGVEPDAEPGDAPFPWVSADALLDDPDFDAYEEITPAAFELELKHYFGIWQKLGFISVVVEPLEAIECRVKCAYSSPYPLAQEIQTEIANEICWEVGKHASAEVLNSRLTDKFNLAAVSVTIAYMNAESEIIPAVEYNQYVRRSGLTVVLEEV